MGEEERKISDLQLAEEELKQHPNAKPPRCE